MALPMLPVNVTEYAMLPEPRCIRLPLVSVFVQRLDLFSAASDTVCPVSVRAALPSLYVTSNRMVPAAAWAFVTTM